MTHPLSSPLLPELIPNKYIVVFKQHTPEDVRQQHCEWAAAAHTEATAARAESDGPELTGVGEQFDFDTLTGYFGSFDENLKNEIEAREEASLTLLLTLPFYHYPWGVILLTD